MLTRYRPDWIHWLLWAAAGPSQGEGNCQQDRQTVRFRLRRQRFRHQRRRSVLRCPLSQRGGQDEQPEAADDQRGDKTDEHAVRAEPGGGAAPRSVHAPAGTVGQGGTTECQQV